VHRGTILPPRRREFLRGVVIDQSRIPLHNRAIVAAKLRDAQAVAAIFGEIVVERRPPGSNGVARAGNDDHVAAGQQVIGGGSAKKVAATRRGAVDARDGGGRSFIKAGDLRKLTRRAGVTLDDARALAPRETREPRKTNKAAKRTARDGEKQAAPRD